MEMIRSSKKLKMILEHGNQAAQLISEIFIKDRAPLRGLEKYLPLSG